jgi:transcription elongation regulator 1
VLSNQTHSGRMYVLFLPCQIVSLTDRSCVKVKRHIHHDPRYDAVGSSSLREELYSAFLKAGALASSSTPYPTTTGSDGTEVQNLPEVNNSEKEQKRKERKERAVREREEKVKADLTRLEVQIDRSRVDLSKEESERQFRCAAYSCSH